MPRKRSAPANAPASPARRSSIWQAAPAPGAQGARFDSVSVLPGKLPRRTFAMPGSRDASFNSKPKPSSPGAHASGDPSWQPKRKFDGHPDRAKKRDRVMTSFFAGPLLKEGEFAIMTARDDPFDYLKRLGEAGEGPHDIAAAALMLSSLDHPTLPLDQQRAHLDEIASLARKEAPLIAGAEDGARLISNLLNARYGYEGDRLTYDDPRSTPISSR